MSDLKNLMTKEKIMNVLSTELQSLETIFFKLEIREKMDTLYVQAKLKLLEHKGEVCSDIKLGVQYWKLNNS